MKWDFFIIIRPRSLLTFLLLKPMEIIKVERLDHLGVVAGVIKDLKLIEIIDERIGVDQDEQITTGEAIAAMILNGLGFANRPLTLMPEFFENKPLALLFREGIEARHFNRFKLGRSLDKVHAYGCDLLFSELAASGCQAEELDLRFRSLDTTTFSLTGEYLPESDTEAITIRHGYSKDHRPDLKQAVLELIVSQDGGVPLFSKSWDGNSSDNTIFKERAASLVESLRSSPRPSYLVADSKLYSEASAKLLEQIGFITRIPATLSIVGETIEAALGKAWVPLSAGYRYQRLEHRHYGIEQRWLVIYSEAARNRSKQRTKKMLKKEQERLEKQLFHLQAQRFASQEQALQALASLEKKLRYHDVVDRHWTAHKSYASAGRPRADTPVKAVKWQLKVAFEVDHAAVEAAIEKGACFVIGTNIAPDQLSDAEVFSAYKGQSSVEQGFRFLKDPLFFVSSLFVKKPSRIAGLLMVMTLALFVYAIAQRRLRKALCARGEQLPNQIKVPTSRPTLRWVFALLDGINRVLVRVEGGVRAILEGLTDLKKKILTLFGPGVQQLYQISSA